MEDRRDDTLKLIDNQKEFLFELNGKKINRVLAYKIERTNDNYTDLTVKVSIRPNNADIKVNNQINLL